MRRVLSGWCGVLCAVLGCGQVEQDEPAEPERQDLPDIEDCTQHDSPVTCGAEPCPLEYATRLVCPPGVANLHVAETALLLDWPAIMGQPTRTFDYDVPDGLRARARFEPGVGHVLARDGTAIARDGTAIVVAEERADGVLVSPSAALFPGVGRPHGLRLVDDEVFVLADAGPEDDASVIWSQKPGQEPVELWRYPDATNVRFLDGSAPELVAVWDAEVTPDEEAFWSLASAVQMLPKMSNHPAVLYENEAAVAAHVHFFAPVTVQTPSRVLFVRGDEPLLCEGPAEPDAAGECYPPSTDTKLTDGAIDATLFDNDGAAWLASLMIVTNRECTVGSCSNVETGEHCGCSYSDQIARFDDHARLVLEPLEPTQEPLDLLIDMPEPAQIDLAVSTSPTHGFVVALATAGAKPMRTTIDYLLIQRPKP